MHLESRLSCLSKEPSERLMQAKCFAAAIAIASLLLSGNVNADYIVASNYPSSDSDSNAVDGVGIISQCENYNNLAAGQSFTPSASGVLTTVDAQIAGAVEVEVPKASPALDISLFKASNNSPTVLLGAVEEQPSDFQSLSVDVNHRYAIDFSQLQISLTAGEQYFIAFQTPVGVPGTVEIWSPYLIGVTRSFTKPFPQPSLGSYSSVAPNGSNWHIDPQAELEITVHAIPEPAWCSLFAVAALACLAVRTPIRKSASSRL